MNRFIMAAGLGLGLAAVSASAAVYGIDFESYAPGALLQGPISFNGNATGLFDSRFIAPGNIEWSSVQAVGAAGSLTGNAARIGISSGNTDAASFSWNGMYVGGLAVGHNAPQDMAMRVTVFGMMGNILTQRLITVPAAGSGAISTAYIDLSDITSPTGGFSFQNPGGVQVFGRHFFVDNITYSDTPIPAPAAGLILPAGLMVMGRRRRSN